MVREGGGKPAIGALSTVSLVAAQALKHSVLGTVVTQMQGMAGSPSRLCKQRKGTTLSVTEPGYRQQIQDVGRTGQLWKVPAGRRGDKHRSSEPCVSLLSYLLS